MPRPHSLPSALACTLLLALLAPAGAHAHGDAEGVERFHEHLDDYEKEVSKLSEELDALVADAAAGRELGGALEELVHHWEEVGVHAAIERKASRLYPPVWQALVAFRKAAEGGADAAALRERARALRAALWQGLGGVKLAAAQVEAAEAGPSEASAGSGGAEDPQETLAAIRDALDRAVEAYEAGEVERAESLVHEAYVSRFEGLEGDLIERDAELVSDLEQAFNARLPMLLQEGAETRAVRAEVRGMKESLERAGELLRETEGERSEVF